MSEIAGKGERTAGKKQVISLAGRIRIIGGRGGAAIQLHAHPGLLGRRKLHERKGILVVLALDHGRFQELQRNREEQVRQAFRKMKRQDRLGM